MAEPAPIEGRCDPRFERVRAAFAREFDQGNEIGAALCVTQEGESVVDLWGGHRDAERTRPWQRDTLANVYSTTKGITAIALHRLVDEGVVDLDAPVARVCGAEVPMPYAAALEHAAIPSSGDVVAAVRGMAAGA